MEVWFGITSFPSISRRHLLGPKNHGFAENKKLLKPCVHKSRHTFFSLSIHLLIAITDDPVRSLRAPMASFMSFSVAIVAKFAERTQDVESVFLKRCKSRLFCLVEKSIREATPEARCELQYRKSGVENAVGEPACKFLPARARFWLLAGLTFPPSARLDWF